MPLAHSVFHSAEGIPLPGWLADLVLVGLPLLALCLVVLLLERRTRPGAAAEGGR